MRCYMNSVSKWISSVLKETAENDQAVAYLRGGGQGGQSAPLTDR